jgi:hypothetical protein
LESPLKSFDAGEDFSLETRASAPAPGSGIPAIAASGAIFFTTFTTLFKRIRKPIAYYPPYNPPSKIIHLRSCQVKNDAYPCISYCALTVKWKSWFNRRNLHRREGGLLMRIAERSARSYWREESTMNVKAEESMRIEYIGVTKVQCPVVAAPVRLKFCGEHCGKSKDGKCKVYALKYDLASSEFDALLVPPKDKAAV